MGKSFAQNYIYSITLVVIILLCVVLRLYKIDSPVGDWHSWRQADTAAVARNFIKFKFDPLRPRYDDLSNIQSGKDNPQGWRMVEFPLYQILGYIGYKSFPVLPIEIWLRLISVIASGGSTFLIYKIVSFKVNRFTAIIAAFVFSVLPYNIYFGRTILPEATMVFFTLLSLYLLLLKDHKLKLVFFLGACVSASIALLIKPTAVFFILPAVYLIWTNNENISKKILFLFCYIIFSLIPLLLWRNWELKFPEGIPAYDWLFNKDNIRFKGAWFYWLFADRIGRLILGYWGLIFLGLGLVTSFSKKEGWFFFWLITGSLMYFIVIAGGNVQHDYYQILIVPTLCILVAKGFAEIIQTPKYFKPAAYFMVSLFFLYMLSFSWYTIRTYYWINRLDLLEAGKMADLLIPKDAKVIAPNGGDTTFLYFINRQGWPEGFDIEKKIAMGATHYVTVAVADSDFETKELVQNHKVLYKNDRFAIIQFK